jgi:hypothetical protein
MLEFERLLALRTLELAKGSAFVVADGVTVKTVDVCKVFVADLARL